MARLHNSRSKPAQKGRNTPQSRGETVKPPSPKGERRSPGAQIRSASTRPQRRNPSQSRAQSTANAIITAAEQLLVQVGYARASTNAIAQRAGVSVGSLYQYFANKEAVFRAIIQRHSDEVKPEVCRALEEMADPRIDLVNATLELLRKLAATNAKDPRLMLAIERELGLLGHDVEAGMNVFVPIRAIVANRFDLQPKELAVVVSLMVETVSHLSRWLVHGKPQDLDTELFIDATGRMLRAILPRRGSRRGRGLSNDSSANSGG